MLGWEMPPYHVGGMGVACYQMCKALSRSGVEIEFLLPYSAKFDIDFMKITPAHPQSVDEVMFAGGIYDTSSYGQKQHSKLLGELDLKQQHDLFAHSVAGHARNSKFDIIHAHDWLTFRAGMRAKEISGKPLIVHVHATEFDRAGGKPGNPLVEEIEYMGFMIADKIIAVSEYTKQVIIDYYQIPADKIEVVHNSIDVSTYEVETGDNAYKYLTEMKKHGWRVVSNVGRLTVQKGLTTLLRAMARVIEFNPKTFLVFVGSGDQYEELIELANELGIGANVHFVNFQHGKRLRDAFAVSDLFVMPSVSEPFGIAPLEAIAFGTPTLVSKQSGVSEVIKNSLKVDFWDVNEMVNKITAVVRNDALRDELHKNSYEEFAKMSWERSVGKIRGLYKSHARGVA